MEPETISWLRLSGAFKKRVVAKGSSRAGGESGNDPWAAAVAALHREAEQWRQHRAAVTVVLSNHFVRYTIIPPVDRGTSSEEALALARFHFAKIHGERAAAWDVRLAPSQSGAPRLASAIDRALLDSLKSCFPRQGKARLRSVQPYMMSAFNFWRHKIDKDGAWLLLVEPSTVCLGMLAGRKWTTIQNVRSSAAVENWLALLEREKHRANIERVPSTVLTRSDLPATAGQGGHEDWHFVMPDLPAVAGMSPHDIERYAMALYAI